jgi:tripartite-type tricarboxylate transporter receptor subunit TctC
MATLLSISCLAHAEIKVPILWPFAVGSNQVNFLRSLIEQANTQQSKYSFYIDYKSGGGGTIAAQHVANATSLTILSSSASFFIRPEFYPNASHKVSDFKPIYIECMNQPALIVSNTFKSMAELREQKRLTIGGAVGSITEAMVRELQDSLPNTEIDFVPFPSGTIAATQEVIARRLDLNVDFPGEVTPFVNNKDLFVVGISGVKDGRGFKTFDSQGYKGFNSLTSNYQLMVSAKTDPQVVEELYNIFARAARASTTLNGYYDFDMCVPANLNFKQTNETYDKWTRYWHEKLSRLKIQ